MALTPGTRLGVFELTELIGHGGMGEVYRARDTKLDRDVAIKILPEAFAHDTDRLARFQREAKTLASLNHPNIAHIHGLEESGGMTALVMELVEGDDLSQRIARGAIPLDEALPIAKQIAEALEAAHEQGIIHRDLKPANIKVRADGTVKVLDFGLAKAMEPAAGSSPSMSMSPTMTTPAMTQAGMILGTAAYMSPEQARGKTVDKRADIWAFGAVLYEMLTGTRAFEGEDIADTLGNVMKVEPSWDRCPSSIPARVVQVMRACLQKNPKQRIDSAQDVRLALEGAFETVVPQSATPAAVFPRRRVALVGVATLLVGAVVAGAAVWVATRPVLPRVSRLLIASSGAAALAINGTDRDVAITPDGSRIIYVGNRGTQLFVRALDALDPVAVFTGALRGPFVSPDGQWIGFVDSFATNVATLKKVAVTGGPAVTLAILDGNPRGATWGPDDAIIFATDTLAAGLQRVAAAGGPAAVLTRPDRAKGELDHLWPELLPGGRAVLFTSTAVTGGLDAAQVAVLDLETGTRTVLVRGGSHAHYVASGHLVYAAAGTLRAVPFDLARLQTRGTPVPVIPEVLTTPAGAADVGVAANGSLVYIPGAGGQQTLVSMDRQGRASPLPGVPLDSYRDVRVSPDGARLAVATQTDVWTYDFARATLSRLTTDPAPDTRPLWTPDGQRIIFTSSRAGYLELFWRPADGTGNDERLLTRAKDLVDLIATGWSADGRQLLFTEVYDAGVPQSRQCAIGQIAIERPSDVKLLVKTGFCNDRGAVSPDGHSMAYRSNVSGQDEIYIERYPELGNRQQISTGGGRVPLWSRNGRELFFSSLDGRQMLAVPAQSGTTLVAGRPQVFFEGAMSLASGGARPYDIAPDGRFVIIRPGQADAAGGRASNLIVVQHFDEELKRLVPTN